MNENDMVLPILPDIEEMHYDRTIIKQSSMDTIFHIESYGQYPPKIILLKSIEILKEKLTNLHVSYDINGWVAVYYT